MTGPCERFAAEALLRREKGLPLDEHFTTCPDCLAARAAYERLEDGIAAAAPGGEPPPGWQQGVWDAIGARQARQREWPWRPLLLGLAAVLAGALLLPLARVHKSATLPSLTVEVERGEGAIRRGTEAQPGDRLVLRAQTGGAPFAELRVYRDTGELLFRCAGEPPCLRRGSELHAVARLDTAGTYQAVLITSRLPLPRGSKGLEADTAALPAGADVEWALEVHVR